MVTLQEAEARKSAMRKRKPRSRDTSRDSARIWCKVCKSATHLTASESCPARLPRPLDDNVTPFKGKLDILSNFYPCTLTVYDREFRSSEHAYQYMKASVCGNDEMAEKICQLECPREVKIISKRLRTNDEWKRAKLDIMRDIIVAKAEYVPEYKEKLLSANQIIAEAVPDDFYWSSGLSKEEIVWVDDMNWPGQNVMGKLHMELREKIRMNENGTSDPMASSLFKFHIVLKEGKCYLFHVKFSLTFFLIEYFSSDTCRWFYVNSVLDLYSINLTL